MQVLPTLKRTTANILCQPVVGRAIRRRRPLQCLSGVLLDLDESIYEPATIARLRWGIYESAELRFINRYLTGNLDVIELGSSIGVTSVHIARKLQHDRRLVCVEANPSLIPPLRRTLARNSVQAHVEHAAIAYGTTAIGFEEGAQTNSGHVNTNSEITVPAMTLDGVCQRHGIDTFAMVADIEGAEAQILQQDRRALARCRQILIELHDTLDQAGQPVTVRNLTDMIIEQGFLLQAEHGPVAAFRRP